MYPYITEGTIIPMEAAARYAKTTDGTSIALWTLGAREPLAYLAGVPWRHVELFEITQRLSWYQLRPGNRILFRYDIQGTGLSHREAQAPWM